jgi:hypothetical protein
VRAMGCLLALNAILLFLGSEAAARLRAPGDYNRWG